MRNLRETVLARFHYGQDRKKGLAPAELRVVRGNTHFTSARIVCVGDLDHLERTRTKIFVPLIKSNAKPGDVVLFEGLESNEPPPYHIARELALPKGVGIIGWDNMKAFKEYTSAHADPEFDRLVAAMDAAREAHDLAAYGNLTEQYKTKVAELKAITTATIATRDQSLITTLEQVRREGNANRIFLFAGMAHLVENTGLLMELRKDKFVILAAANSKKVKVSPEEVEKSSQYINRLNRKN